MIGYSSGQYGAITPVRDLIATRSVLQGTFSRKLHNKSFIDEACSVKIAGYWPRSFFWELIDPDSIWSLRLRTRPIYPAVFISCSVNTSYVQDKQNAVLYYLQQSKQLVLDELTPNQSNLWYHSPLSTSSGACYE